MEEVYRDTYLEQKLQVLRNYQIQILEIAKQQNTIIYLPTGAGKTLIAINVLKSKSLEITKPYSEGGKRAFFVANTKVLAHQITKTLEIQTSFKVRCYTGNLNLDNWDRKQWLDEFENNNVLVLTAEILRQILALKFISFQNISLLVFDECHHAISNHPYREVLRNFEKVDLNEMPLITGMSAVLVHSDVKNVIKLNDCIKKLEAVYRAKIVSSPNLDEVLHFSARPSQKIITYSNNDDNNLSLAFYDVRKIYDGVIDMFKNLHLTSKSSVIDGSEEYKKKSISSLIKRVFVSMQKNLNELGLFCGSLSALLNLIHLEKMRLLSTDQVESDLLMCATTELIKARRIFAKKIDLENVTVSSIYQFSSPKVQKLIDVVIHNYTLEQEISALLFVREKNTAVILAYMFKKLAEMKNGYSFLKPNYAVGSSMFDVGFFELNKKTSEKVSMFIAKDLNLLVATNILEEGIDVPHCNVIISFDFPTGFSSYFQAKGRGRDEKSTYYLFVEENEKVEKLNCVMRFEKLGNELQNYTFKESLENINETLEETDLIEKITLNEATGKEIDAITAIRAVDRYCSLLPQDKFSNLTALVRVKNVPAGKQCFILLPTVCPVNEKIVGETRRSKKLAKRSVYLKAAKRLYDIGELDENLNYQKYKYTTEDWECYKKLLPHFKKEVIDEILPQPGTKKRKQTYRVEFAKCLRESLPQPDVLAYMHVIKFTVAFSKPCIDRKIAIYDLLKTSCTYAMLSTKKLSKICQFSLFLNLGRVDCELLVNFKQIKMTAQEIEEIKLFHFSLIKKVMEVSKSAQVYDDGRGENSYFIVPVEKNEENDYILNWDLVRCDFCKNSLSAVVRYNPSANIKLKRRLESENLVKQQKVLIEESISEKSQSVVPLGEVGKQMLWPFNKDEKEEPRFTMTETDYKYFVISPNYRGENQPSCYAVTKVCHDMTPLSEFPKQCYENYFEYYKDKYDIEITNSRQPLLKVSILFTASNFNKPVYVTGNRNQRLMKKVKEYDEHLIPELCDVFFFPSKYWIKANLLPTVLSRIAYIYNVDEFRRELVASVGLGKLDIPDGVEWKPLKEELDYSEEKSEDPKSPVISLHTSTKLSSLPLSALRGENSQNDLKSALDLYQNLEEVGICDVEYYVQHFKNFKILDNSTDSLINNRPVELKNVRNDSVPSLSIFSINENCLGLELAELVKALTAKSANDLVNYERVETIGDSFLKFAITFFLFAKYDMNEGILTALKGQIVGNRNLLYCGQAKNIQNFINVIDFAPQSNWNPPLLSVPEKLMKLIVEEKTDSFVINQFEVPFEEQFSGNLSKETYQRNEAIILGYEKCEESVSEILPFRRIADKTVSDCVEALIGVYLQAFGLPGAFEFLTWMNILPPDCSFSQLFETSYSNQLLQNETEVSVTKYLDTVLYTKLEDILGYTFNHKALLLEALTHPSYQENRLTNCYQRLEFLGDAVLDFLITSYIYEYCGNLTPGQITDIRSALVNNVTFGCLSVRYSFHKFLLSFNSALNKSIEKFVTFQTKRNHVVDENILILVEESDCLIAENVQVPKPLGDVFESIAGAIFLDSQSSLSAVWKVYYKLMKDVIDQFTKSIPKTSVRLLSEICRNKPSFEYTHCSENTTKAVCTAYYKYYEITAHGFGATRKDAKRSAAKLAVKKILEMKSEQVADFTAP